MELPPLNETNCPPGTPLKPYQLTYDREQLRKYLDRTGETEADYQVDGQQVVPPGMFLGAYGRLIHETFHYEAGVHVSSDLELRRVANLGETVTVSGNALKLFERNGDKYVTFDVIITGTDGDRLARVEHTSVYALRPRPRG
jgi:hypothetical protein